MADVVINIDNLTFGDMEVLMSWKGGGGPESYSKALDVLDRCVEGGVRKLPIAMANDIVAAIEAAVVNETDEKN